MDDFQVFARYERHVKQLPYLIDNQQYDSGYYMQGPACVWRSVNGFGGLCIVLWCLLLMVEAADEFMSNAQSVTLLQRAVQAA